MHACVNQQYACLKELLSCGKFSSEHVNKVSRTGFTALMLCAKEGFLEGIKLLIDNKSDINTVAYQIDSYHRQTNNRTGIQHSFWLHNQNTKNVLGNCWIMGLTYGLSIEKVETC